MTQKRPFIWTQGQYYWFFYLWWVLFNHPDLQI